jgi:hypothetical protein
MDATTFNPADKHADVTLSGGNLTATVSYGYPRKARCTIFLDSGKYYIESVFDTLTSAWGLVFGLANDQAELTLSLGSNDHSMGFFIDTTVGTYGAIRMSHNGTTTTIWEKPSAPALASGDIIQLAVDIDNGDVWVGHENVWVGDPAAGTGASRTGWDFGASGLTIACSLYSGGQVSLVNAPASQTYTAPTGFAAKWATQVEADITAAMGASLAVPGLTKEKHASISGDLGAYSEPWKWFQSGGTGNGEIDDNLLLFPAGLSSVLDVYNVTSPIQGDLGLGETTEMYRWHGGYLVSDPQVGLGFTPSVELQYEVESIFEGTGLGCSCEVLNFSEFLRDNKEVTKRYFCVLTGLADGTTDITLPISSVQGRFRSGSPSYLSVQVPTYQYLDEILARSNGDIVVYSALLVAGVEQFRQEIARATLEDPRSDRGGRSQTVTLSGHSTETFGSESVTLQDVQETGEGAGGKKRVVAAVDLFLRPGNTAVVPGFASFTVGLISYSITVKGEKMKVTEA